MGIRDSLEFSSDLPDNVISKCIKMLPETNNKVCIINSASIRLNGETYDLVYVCVTHFSIFIFRTIVGVCSQLAHIDNADLYEFVLSDNPKDGFLMKSKEFNIIVKGPDHIRLSRVIYRNIQMIISKYNISAQIDTHVSNQSLFPKISFKMPISQVFQYTYASYCAKYNEEYNHSLVSMVWKLITAGDYCFDCSCIPNLEHHKAFYKSISILPCFNFFLCNNKTEICPTRLLNNFLLYSSNLTGVVISQGTKEDELTKTAQILRNINNKNIILWKISGRELPGIRQFVTSLMMQKAQIRMIDLSETNMDEKTLCILFKGLTNNTNLHRLHSLNIKGSKITKRSKKAFFDWIAKLHQKGEFNLNVLGISDTGNYAGKICNALCSSNQPLIHIDVSYNVMSEWAQSQLIQLVLRSPNLRSINVSGCNLNVENLIKIIRTFSNETKSDSYKFFMSQLNLTGTELAGAISAFLDCDSSRWSLLNFDNTKFDDGSSRMVLSVLNSLNYLTTISLNGCFTSKLTGIGERLKDLLKLPYLKKLSISGVDKGRLKTESYPLLEGLSENKTIECLDIRNNKVGDEGIKILDRSLVRNSSLKQLEIDDNWITSVEVLSMILRRWKSRPQSHYMTFPYEDAERIISNAGIGQKDKMRERIRNMEIEFYAQLCINRRESPEHPANAHFNPPLQAIQHLEASTKRIDELEDMQNKYDFSCFNFSLKIPLPFQSAMPESAAGSQQIDIGDVSLYDTDCLDKIIRYNPFPNPDNEDAKKELVPNPANLIQRRSSTARRSSASRRSSAAKPSNSGKSSNPEKINTSPKFDKNATKEDKQIKDIDLDSGILTKIPAIDIQDPDSSDDEEEEIKPKKSTKPAPLIKKIVITDSDEDLPVKKPKKKQKEEEIPDKKNKKKQVYDEEDEIPIKKKSNKPKVEDSDDEIPVKKNKKRRNDMDSDEDDEVPVKKSKKKILFDSDDEEVKKSPSKKKIKSYIEDSDEDDRRKPVKATQKHVDPILDNPPIKKVKKPAKILDSSEDSDDIYAEKFQPRMNASSVGNSTLFMDSSSDEETKPRKKYSKKTINMKLTRDDDSDDDSEPLPVPRKRPNVQARF